MSLHEAIQTAIIFFAGFGGLAVFGGLGIVFAAWAWYRRDGGRLGFWEFLRGI